MKKTTFKSAAILIRYVAVQEFVLPVLEDGSVRFTIRDAHAAVKEVDSTIQQQAVRSALAARTPLLNPFGITWVQQDGPATQYQEVRWQWDPDNQILNVLKKNR